MPDDPKEIAIVEESTIRNKIYEVRGMKVMLDFELAEIYGYSTTAFNQQVKNNAEKFEGDDFSFYITPEEFRILISKNLTSSWGGRRESTRIFTESGIYVDDLSSWKSHNCPKLCFNQHLPGDEDLRHSKRNKVHEKYHIHKRNRQHHTPRAISSIDW